MTRHLLLPLLLAVAVMGTATAAAEETAGRIQGYYDEAYHYHPTPKHWMVELKFGPYRPNVDAEPGLSGKPYDEIFGCGPVGENCSTWDGWQVMSQVELDYQFWQPHGSFAVAVTLGFFRITGKALVPQDPSLPPDPETNPYVRSGDETALNILPVAVQLVYRWDYAALHYSVPLVPYVKFGLAYAFWWIENAEGIAELSDGAGAYGGTIGYQLNAGLAIMLDFLEPSAAKTMDAELGINHTYLFCEFLHSQVRWGLSDKMRLGVPASFLAGLAFEF